MELNLSADSIAGVAFFVAAALFVVGFAVWIAVDTRRRRRRQAAADATYVAAHPFDVERTVADVEAVLRTLRSPVVPPSLHSDWNELQRRLAAAPGSREAREQLITARRNAEYLSGLERGDVVKRRQAVNELVFEARSIGASDIAGALADLRARVSWPSFCEEFSALAAALGPVAQQWSDAEISLLADFSSHNIPNDKRPQIPPFYEIDFRPGAGINGFIPVGSVWRSIAVFAKRHFPEDYGASYPGHAVYFKRWLPTGGVR